MSSVSYKMSKRLDKVRFVYDNGLSISQEEVRRKSGHNPSDIIQLINKDFKTCQLVCRVSYKKIVGNRVSEIVEREERFVRTDDEQLACAGIALDRSLIFRNFRPVVDLGNWFMISAKDPESKIFNISMPYNKDGAKIESIRNNGSSMS